MTASHIGKSVWVASALPATNDAAGFAALTWVRVNGVQILPQLGVTHAAIEVPDLGTGFTTALKGAATGVDTSMTFRDVPSDTGQGTLKTLSDAASGACSLRLVKGTGAGGAPASGNLLEYAQGFLHSYVAIQGDDSSHEGFTVSFRQNAATVEGTFA